MTEEKRKKLEKLDKIFNKIFFIFLIVVLVFMLSLSIASFIYGEYKQGTIFILIAFQVSIGIIQFKLD